MKINQFQTVNHSVYDEQRKFLHYRNAFNNDTGI